MPTPQTDCRIDEAVIAHDARDEGENRRLQVKNRRHEGENRRDCAGAGFRRAEVTPGCNATQCSRHAPRDEAGGMTRAVTRQEVGAWARHAERDGYYSPADPASPEHWQRGRVANAHP